MKYNGGLKESYSLQVAHEQMVAKKGKLPVVYSQPKSIDAWRHDMMRDRILPLIDYDKASYWLTLGDGMYGTDANYLESKGVRVVASSLSDETLKIAKAKGLIKEFRVINAESITEPEESFDYVFCKEAFHHFPRPYIALYEMLRVCKKGIVLIEPQESRPRLLNSVKKWIKTVWRKDTNTQFEPAGNFIYRINIREVEKTMTALGYKCMALQKFNDFFLPAIASGSRDGFNKSKLVFRLGIGFQNLLCTLGLMDYGLVCLILFKDDIEEPLRSGLRKNGFVLKQLPKNPYKS